MALNFYDLLDACGIEWHPNSDLMLTIELVSPIGGYNSTGGDYGVRHTLVTRRVSPGLVEMEVMARLQVQIGDLTRYLDVTLQLWHAFSDAASSCLMSSIENVGS